MSAASFAELDLPLPAASRDWIARLPDGAVSVETDGSHWKLRASQSLQDRLETLLERYKQSALSSDEDAEYRAICELDHFLSGFNRLARRLQQG